jgi:protein-disulfide isomerase
MQNMKLFIGVIGGTLLLVVIVAFLFSGQGYNPNTPAPAVNTDVLMNNVHHKILGSAVKDGEFVVNESSPSGEVAKQVTLVEFSDFQCPACQSTDPLIRQLLEKYGNKVQFVYRNFPLEQIHKNARAAAIAAEFASAQGKFWQYHDKLFDNHDEWAEQKDPKPFFKKYAQELDLDIGTFDGAFSDPTLSDIVDTDVRDGNALGVNATPTFYLDGVKTDTNLLDTTIGSKV